MIFQSHSKDAEHYFFLPNMVVFQQIIYIIATAKTIILGQNLNLKLN